MSIARGPNERIRACLDRQYLDLIISTIGQPDTAQDDKQRVTVSFQLDHNTQTHTDGGTDP
ncbi:MAG: hypothetical protein PHF48_07420 [Bacteroidales bacterium]|nr:hypothetical protein [Bacteroidales bacterium]